MASTADPKTQGPPTPRARADSGPCDGVLWFGNVDWWYHNRGHSSVRMSIRLARRVPTVYVNSIGMRMPVPGQTEVAWKRYARKLKSLTKGLRRDRDTGLWVCSPSTAGSWPPRSAGSGATWG
jgi:hypothetical protein